MKVWEDIAETLSIEVKREIAESYFQEKIALEEAWKDYEEQVKRLCKKEEDLIFNVCRLMLMLKEDHLMEEFQNITDFSLRSCYHPQILESSNIRRRLFEKLRGLPFGFTSKSRFVKLFLQIYEDLCRAYKNYLSSLNKLEKTYQILKEETQKFYKRFDLSSIFSFFGRLETQAPSEIAIPEEKDKIYEELRQKLSLTIPESPSSTFEIYNPPRELSKIRFPLITLAKKAYQAHQEYAKELMKLVPKKD